MSSGQPAGKCIHEVSLHRPCEACEDAVREANDWYGKQAYDQYVEAHAIADEVDTDADGYKIEEDFERDPLTAPRPMTSEERRRYPLTTGLLDYFPDACLEVAHTSYVANEHHNPGEPMHWAKEKSIGEGDQIGRHLLERADWDTDNLRHAGKLAWRAMEYLQRLIEKERARRAKVPS